VTCGSNGYCADDCGAAEANRSNIGCEYWAVPLANLGQFTEAEYDFRVVVANPDDMPASVRVFRGTTLAAETTVAPGGLDDISLPWISGMSDGIAVGDTDSIATPNGAYRVISDRPVTVAQFNPFEYDSASAADFSFTNDASLLLPSHSFTGEYIASSFVPLSRTQVTPGFPPLIPESRDSLHWPGYVAVSGVTPEPTTVNVALTAPIAAEPGGKFGASAAGTTVSFTLERGEVVHLVSAPPPACASGRPGFVSRVDEEGLEFCDEAQYDLTGSRIQSNHPVAVFGGHTCAYVPYDAQACDHLENQMPPLQTWGTEYFTAPMGDPSSPEVRNVVRVTAAFDGTDITVEPSQDGVGSVTLGAGEWVEFDSTSPFRVNGSRGIMVTQYLVGQFASEPEAERGDPAMVVLPPGEQYRSDYTFVTPTSYNASTEGQSFLLVIRPPGLDITLDGSSLSGSFEAVGGREVAIVPVEGGTHQMNATDTFGVIVFGMGQFTSYAYPAGLNLEEILLI